MWNSLIFVKRKKNIVFYFLYNSLLSKEIGLKYLTCWKIPKKNTSQWLTRKHRFLRRNAGFGLRYLYIYYNQMAFCVVLWDEAESHTELPRSCEQVSWTLSRQGRIGPWGYKHLNPRMKHCLSIKCSPPQYTLLSWAPPRQQKGQTVQPKAVGHKTLPNQRTLQGQ